MPQVNPQFPIVTGSIVLNEPWHLFITYGPNKDKKTHLGGFDTYEAAQSEMKQLRPKADAMFKDEPLVGRFKYVFLVAEGPVAVTPDQQQYGTAWDKN